jgi:LPXTG-site transpeptidase (sortase) family protein
LSPFGHRTEPDQAPPGGQDRRVDADTHGRQDAVVAAAAGKGIMARNTPFRLSWSWFAAGLCVVAAGAFAWFGTASRTGGERSAVTVTLAGAPDAAAVDDPAFPTISRGGLPTRVVIPSAAVDAPVAEVGVVVEDGVAMWETAWRAAGHHIDSALPGQPGNVVITGHVSVADRRNLAAFATLDSVVPGDAIEVYSGTARYVYTVDRVMVVAPDAVHLLRSDSAATVTLITCTRDLKERLVVVGTLTTIENTKGDA